MKMLNLKIALTVFLIAGVGALSYGQDKAITVGDIPLKVSSKVFTTKPVATFEKGASEPAYFIIRSGGYEGWSVRMRDFVIGEQTVKYPVFGIVNCSGFDSTGYCTMIASTTVFTADIKAGEALRSGGYLIEAKRSVKAGEAVPTLLLIGNSSYSILSIEAAPATKEKGDAAKPQPWLTIFDERLKPGDRSLALETWRSSNVAAEIVRTLAGGPAR